MRRLIGCIGMTLVVSAASLAGAHDGAKVIYDLSELGRETLPETVMPTGTEKANWSNPSLSFPGEVNGSNSDSELEIQWNAGNLELAHKRGRARNNRGPSQTPPQEGFGDSQTATPNPEPGTLILMGSGLLAGARYVRRRKNC